MKDNKMNTSAVLFIFSVGMFVGMTLAATAAYYGVFSACGG